MKLCRRARARSNICRALKPQQPNAVVNLTSPLQVTDAALSKPIARARSDLVVAPAPPLSLSHVVSCTSSHHCPAIATAISCPATLCRLSPSVSPEERDKDEAREDQKEKEGK
ncbi:hypothetical protein M0R45_027367 [Rubus argutus]|uniref:Uncharacterized protein n=1 Tax=Rubus argutus TaxID=59490 RepID=A0AAW1X2Y3_RUBAR